MAEFMTPEEHLKALVNSLDNEEKKLYASLKHLRHEACFLNRTFVVYEIVDRAPKVLDNLKVLDFSCNEKHGASTEIYSSKEQHGLVVGYEPVQLFDYPVMVWLPTHGKLRWSTTPDKPLGGTLAFDLLIKTASRFMLRERGVVYCETGVDYAREFEGHQR